MTLRRGRRRRTTTWTRAGIAKRTKEMWHIPKRSNLTQIVGALQILIDPNIGLSEKAWTTGRKETFNTELAKRKFTESGGPLSPSGLRTLEALLKYLGLIYYDPPIIRVTEAGIYFLKNPEYGLRLQMAKLQLTNPVVSEDCEGLQVFPFRTTLRLLEEPELHHYLSYDEMGYLVFMRMRFESDYEKVKQDIIHFRLLNPKERQERLERFKSTPEGQVTLVKAPSVCYYVSLCTNTGLCEGDSANRQLKIRPGKEAEVRSLLSQFRSIETYDFGRDIDLWIQYYGKPSRLAPPRNIPISFFEGI